jgi:hypothetical protein
MPRDIAPAHEKAPAEYNPAGAKPREVSCANLKETETYFSEVLMSVNLVLRFVPRPLTTAIMASEMPAAIKPYSMAVAPDSSEKKLNKVRFNTASLGFQGGNPSTTLRYPSESKAGLTRELQFYIEVGSTFSPISCVGPCAGAGVTGAAPRDAPSSRRRFRGNQPVCRTAAPAKLRRSGSKTRPVSGAFSRAAGSDRYSAQSVCRKSRQSGSDDIAPDRGCRVRSATDVNAREFMIWSAFTRPIRQSVPPAMGWPNSRNNARGITCRTPRSVAAGVISGLGRLCEHYRHRRRGWPLGCSVANP